MGIEAMRNAKRLFDEWQGAEWDDGHQRYADYYNALSALSVIERRALHLACRGDLAYVRVYGCKPSDEVSALAAVIS